MIWRVLISSFNVLSCVVFKVPLYVSELAQHSRDPEAPCVLWVPKCLVLKHTELICLRVLPAHLVQSDPKSYSSLGDSTAFTPMGCNQTKIEKTFSQSLKSCPFMLIG